LNQWLARGEACIRKLQVNAEEIGIKTGEKPGTHHKDLKLTTNA
jgi:hypothetical protein